jgi:hypothetical protein
VTSHFDASTTIGAQRIGAALHELPEAADERDAALLLAHESEVELALFVPHREHREHVFSREQGVRLLHLDVVDKAPAHVLLTIAAARAASLAVEFVGLRQTTLPMEAWHIRSPESEQDVG